MNDTTKTEPLPAGGSPLDGGVVPLRDRLHLYVSRMAQTHRECSNGALLIECEAEIDRLTRALEKIEVKAQAGLCYFTLESAREFLKDVRDEVADALRAKRPRR